MDMIPFFRIHTMQTRFSSKMYNLAGVLLVFCAVVGCTPESPVDSRSVPDYWPTNGWRTSTPEQQGIDSEILADALEHINEKDLALHSLLIVRHGYVILDAYFYPYSGKTAHDVASVTKSITSSLIGIAHEKGYIKDLDRPVLEYFPGLNISNHAGKKQLFSVKELMSMSSGLECGYKPGEAELFAMRNSEDWVRYTLDLPMASKPGTEFAYCSSGTHLLSAIIRQTTGMSTLDFAQEHLFTPLGIKQVFWPADSQGNNHGWGDLQMHPHDMARIGYLYLNRGQWNAVQILSAEWVARATQEQIALRNEQGGYGYGWWLASDKFPGMYEARGRGGQGIIVWPEKDLVVVTTAGGADPGELAPFLLSALKTERNLAANPGAYSRLQKSVKDAARSPGLQQAVSSMPETAFRISGKTYRLGPNKLGVTAFTLQFNTSNEATFEIDADGRNYTMPVGLDDVYRFSADGPSGVPVALEGYWKTDNTFALHYHEAAGINNLRISMTFEQEEVVIQLDDASGYFDQTITGQTQ